MPHWMLVILFCSIIGALVIIVAWELKRMRRPPGFKPGTLKHFLSSEAVNPTAPVAKGAKRGIDW